jgi:cyclohexanecarboxylate-CoA ligase
VPPTLIAEARDVLGVCLGAAWGMTEVGCVTVTDVHQPDDAATSDGRVVHWMELKVIGPDGAELPRGEQGRLVSRGPSQFLGYLKRQDLYNESLTADGFFDSGDLARMDETGAIRITGRTKDLIIRGGESVPAVEVEACLYRHPDIDEVSVVGLPDERQNPEVRPARSAAR